GPVLEGVTHDADAGGKFRRLDFVRENLHRVGLAHADGHLEDGFGQRDVVLDGAGAPGQDDPADEVFGEAARVEVLADLDQQLFGPFEDDHVEFGAFHDGGRTGHDGVQLDPGGLFL